MLRNRNDLFLLLLSFLIGLSLMPLKDLLDSYNPLDALKRALDSPVQEELPKEILQPQKPTKTVRLALSSIERDYPTLPSGTLLAVMSKETGGTSDPVSAVSPTGARGPFQHMPSFLKDYKISDPTNLSEAAHGTAKALSSLNKKFQGDWAKTFAAYHSGATRVVRDGLENLGPVGKQYYQDILAHLDGNEIPVSKRFKQFLDSPMK